MFTSNNKDLADVLILLTLHGPPQATIVTKLQLIEATEYGCMYYVDMSQLREFIFTQNFNMEYPSGHVLGIEQNASWRNLMASCEEKVAFLHDRHISNNITGTLPMKASDC
jgi:hypothetical protein